MSEKIVLIDGNSIANRAFFGVPPLTNSEGIHTNAIYGFLNIMFRILNEENPDFLVVAFDVHEPTFRHKMYEQYKGTRKGMPDELKEQMPLLKDVLLAMGITIMQKGGLEADDILGTLAKRAEKENMAVTIVSGDRDLLQIATDNILIRIPKTRAGKTEIENYYAKDVVEKYGLKPYQIIELKGLMGDSADNIPGVPKVGEKTATELLKIYGTIDNLKGHIDEIKKNSIRESLTENFHMAELSRTLATIETNADIELDFKKARLENIFTADAYAIIKKLGFKNMLSKFSGIDAPQQEDYKKNFVLIDNAGQAKAVFEKIRAAKSAGFYFVPDGENVKLTCSTGLLGLALSLPDKTYFVPVVNDISMQWLLDEFIKTVNGSGDVQIVTFDFKSCLWLFTQLSDTSFLKKSVTDLLIAAYLCNPLKNDYTICDIAGEYLNLTIKTEGELFGKQEIRSVYSVNPEIVADYACTAAYVCKKAAEPILNRLAEIGEMELYRDIEMPLIGCLFDMERFGIRILPSQLKDYSKELEVSIETLKEKINEAAGEEFNLNSPKQLGEILFDKMGIPGAKKTKTGYSTSAEVLEKLAPEYPFVADILKYRALSKLKSTYTDSLLQCVANDGRIHSTFNQTITATGRISSVEPNLQNIPVRMQEGRLIRKAFVPKEGYCFVDADYSQIELRLMAHLSKDAQLIEAFCEGADVHAITASKVFKTPLSEVTPLMRRNAKAVNFGIIYGISAFGLSEDLNISRKEAKEFIESYFATFPGVKKYLDEQVAAAKEKGYVTTPYGRRRPIPELKSSNFMQKSFGERVAMNAPIQGMAADIMKLAMIRVKDRIAGEKLKSRLILQVHDELIIEAAIDEVESVKCLLKEEMEGAASLSVPLPVSLSVADTWYDAK